MRQKWGSAGLIVVSACAFPSESARVKGANEPTELLPIFGDRSPRLPQEAVTKTLPPSEATVAVTQATLLIGNGQRIENGTLVFSRGKITQIGPADKVSVPEGAQIINGRGRFVTPGLIDTHSHMGVYGVPQVVASRDGNEMTSPTTPYVFSEDAFWPQDPAIRRAVAGGITTAQILPGSGNLIGGRAVTLKLRPRLEARAMRFPNAPFGLKMACGENPKRVHGGERKRQPMSRMGNLGLMRKAFVRARQYRFDMNVYEAQHAAWQKRYDAAKADGNAAPGKEPRRPSRDIGLETLADVLDGKIKVHIHCYRADEMLLMMSLAKEMGYKISSFHHAVEAYKIADVLAAQQVSASIWSDWWGFKMEAYDGVEENAAILERAGARPIIHSDSNIGIQRLNQDAAKALYAGRRLGLELEEDEAIKWVTSNPAWALGIDGQTGTLEKGKMADVVVWDRSPLSIYSSAQQVYIDGVLVHDARKPAKSWSDFEVGTEMEESVR